MSSTSHSGCRRSINRAKNSPPTEDIERSSPGAGSVTSSTWFFRSKLRIVLPRRVGEPERREDDALPVARQRVKPLGEEPDELLGGDVPVVDEAPSRVHGLARLLEVEESSIRGRQSVVQLTRHRASSP